MATLTAPPTSMDTNPTVGTLMRDNARIEMLMWFATCLSVRSDMEAYSRRKNRNIPWNVYTLNPNRKDKPSAITVEAMRVNALLVTNPCFSIFLLRKSPTTSAAVATRMIFRISTNASHVMIFSATNV